MRASLVVFDAYGTLFDVSSAAARAATQPGQEALAEIWQPLSATWRGKQLEYSWLRAITGDHTDFWTVTCDALDWAMEAHGISDPTLRETLLALYWELSPYPEAPKALAHLKAAGHLTAILSNGSPEMLEGAVDHAGIERYLDRVISVEEAGIFKPSARVYDLVGRHFGMAPRDVLFVSSNGWDICSAAGYGFATAWVNRTGQPPERLPHAPDRILADLAPVPALADGHTG